MTFRQTEIQPISRWCVVVSRHFTSANRLKWSLYTSYTLISISMVQIFKITFSERNSSINKCFLFRLIITFYLNLFFKVLKVKVVYVLWIFFFLFGKDLLWKCIGVKCKKKHEMCRDQVHAVTYHPWRKSIFWTSLNRLQMVWHHFLF